MNILKIVYMILDRIILGQPCNPSNTFDPQKEPGNFLRRQKYTTTNHISAAFGHSIKMWLLFVCRKIMAAKFHLCLLLIILGTIAVQGARPGKPDFFRRQPGCKWFLLRLYILRTYALIFTAHPYCALNSFYNVTPH